MVAAVIGQCLIFVHVVRCLSLYHSVWISPWQLLLYYLPKPPCCHGTPQWNGSRTRAHNLPLPCVGSPLDSGQRVAVHWASGQAGYTCVCFSNVIPIWECSMYTAWYCNWSALSASSQYVHMYCTAMAHCTVDCKWHMPF